MERCGASDHKATTRQSFFLAESLACGILDPSLDSESAESQPLDRQGIPNSANFKCCSVCGSGSLMGAGNSDFSDTSSESLEEAEVSKCEKRVSFFFGRVAWLVGSQFPHQGLSPEPRQ